MTAGCWKNSRTKESKKKRNVADERRQCRKVMYAHIRTAKRQCRNSAQRKALCAAIRKHKDYRMCKK